MPASCGMPVVPAPSCLESRHPVLSPGVPHHPMGGSHYQARTSLTHPLRIAKVLAKSGGRVGLTFCPGKKQCDAMSGWWDRDLGLDLDAVRAWDATVVLTLIEAHEIKSLGVEALADEIAARGMIWHHLPIPDVSAPPLAFEAAYDCIRTTCTDAWPAAKPCWSTAKAASGGPAPWPHGSSLRAGTLPMRPSPRSGRHGRGRSRRRRRSSTCANCGASPAENYWRRAGRLE